VRASPRVLEVLARIYAPWASEAPGAAGGGARRELLRGVLLLRGLRKQEGWAWRRVRLHAAAIHVLEHAPEGGGGEWAGRVEETLPLEALVVSSDVVRGRPVIALQRLEGGGVLVLHAGAHHTAWLARVQAAQKRLDPYRDWDTPYGARPGELIVPTAKTGGMVTGGGGGWRFGWTVGEVEVLLEGTSREGGDPTPLLHCRLRGVRSKVSPTDTGAEGEVVVDTLQYSRCGPAGRA
ncbi:hypothetical protein T484DRAFT_1840451, partial [Baffinella frigidus]